MESHNTTVQDLVSATARMRHLARALLGCPHDAEDVAQDAWCQALGTAETVRDPDAWLRGVARNVARHHRRADRRRRRREGMAARDESESASSLAYEHLEALRRVVAAVYSLRQPYRSALVLQYVVGLSAAEAANVLGVNRATLRSQVHRGLELLRTELGDARPDGRKGWQVLAAPLAAVPIKSTLGGAAMLKSVSAAGVALLLVLGAAASLWFALGGTAREQAGTDVVGDLTPDSPRSRPALEATSRDQQLARNEGQPQADRAAQLGLLSGRVVDELSNAPIAGARLILFEPRQESGKQLALTDDGGLFSIPLDADSAGGELHVFATGYRPLRVSLTVGMDAPLQLALESGEQITGVVVDERGKPVAGARVWVYLPGNRTAWPHRADRFAPNGESDGAAGTTDAMGGFVLGGLSREHEYLVRCAGPGRRQYVHHADRLGGLPVARGGDAGLRLWLTTALDVRLLAVHSKTREPLAIAPTWLVAPPTGFKGETRGRSLEVRGAPREHLDQDASFVFRAHAFPDRPLYGQSIRVVVRALGFAPFNARVELGSLRNAVHEVPMAPLHEDSSYGELAVSPRVGEHAYVGGLAVSVTAVGGQDAGGGPAAFRIESSAAESVVLPLPPGRYTVHARGTGPAGAWWPVPATSAEVAVSPASRTPLSLSLAGNPVTIRVQDADGRERTAYDLQVSGPTRQGHWEGAWDHQFGSTSETRRVVWVPRGQITIAAWKGVVGYGSATVSADGLGTPLSVLITLDPDARPTHTISAPRPR